MKADRLADPSEWVVRFTPLLQKNSEILDIAAGSGRHAIWLAAQGHRVTAIDRDVSSLTENVETRRDELTEIEIIEADLETGEGWPLGNRKFDGIIVTNYLHRPLFPAIAAAVKEEGLLIYETFALGNEVFGKPSNPDFLLQPGELKAVFGEPFRIVAFEEGKIDRPKPAIIQRICVAGEKFRDAEMP